MGKPLAAFIGALLGACAAMQPAPLSPERVATIVASPDRSPTDRTNDERRKPAEMLAFIGMREGMVALDVSAAGGYTTELIARAVGPTGRVYGQTSRPDPRQRLAERAKTVKNIVAVVRPFEDPAPPEVASNALDLVTLMFNYHDFGHLGVDRAKLNRAIYAALKPGGLYVIADHAGRAGTGHFGIRHAASRGGSTRAARGRGRRLSPGGRGDVSAQPERSARARDARAAATQGRVRPQVCEALKSNGARPEGLTPSFAALV